MGYCANLLPAGYNEGCLKFPAPLDNIIITDEDVSFTEAEFLVYANWREEIQEDLDAFIPASVTSYEVTTDDPTINTTSQLRKTVVRTAVPSATFWLDSNPCDWSDVLRTLKGGTYRIFFVLADNSIIGYKDRNGSEVKGFKVELTAMTPGVPLPDAVESNFRLYANFLSLAEFESSYQKSMEWSVMGKLPAATPLGYSMDFVSETQSTATVVVNVFERCGDAITGLATADINVLDSTLTDDTVASVTDNGSGSFDVAFTTAAAGQWVKFEVKELTGTIVDAISNPLYVEFT